MQIRSEQFFLLEANFRARRRDRLLKEVRLFLLNMPSMADVEALRRIDEAIEDGKLINITRDEDLVRFAALAFLPESVLGEPSFASALVRTLNRDQWAASKRLDFIYRHLVGNLIPAYRQSLRTR